MSIVSRSRCLPALTTLTALACVALVATPASAIPLIGNLPSNDGSGTGIGSNGIKAVAFTTPSSAYAVESVDVRLENADPGENIFVRLYANNLAGDAPATTDGSGPLATFITPAFTSTAATTYNFTLTTPFVLAPSTTYWIAVVGGANANFDWLSSLPFVTPTSTVGFSNAGYRISGNNGAAYTGSSVPNSYQLNGSAVAVNGPEPASLALLALGTIAGGMVLRRRVK